MKTQLAIPSMEPANQSAADLELVFREHSAMVFRAAYRVTGSAMDAEDVLQTVFVRLLQRASGSEAIENVGSFLHRSAVNAGLDVLRARRNIRGVPLDDLEPVLAESPHRGPDRAWDSLVIQDWLREALARLNPRIAQMFILRFFEGKENREIAAILNTTPGTVAVTISRTRDKLRQEYRERAGGVA